jgi:hypothetical protein
MSPGLLQQLEDEIWLTVPGELRRLVKCAAGPARVVHLISTDLPDNEKVAVWYNPDDQNVLFHGIEGEKAAAWAEQLSQVPFVANVVQLKQPIAPGDGGEPWLLVKRAFPIQNVMGPMAMLTGHKPGLWPTAPNTLTATLGSTLLGGGLGYGLGWLGEQVLPEKHFEKGKLRRTGAILGALGGAVPSLWYGLRGGYRQDPPGTPLPSQEEPPNPNPEFPKAGAYISQAKRALTAVLPPEERGLDKHYVSAVNKLFKKADFGTEGGGGSSFLPVIPTDQFNQTVWNDPFTPAAIRAATTGLVEAASLSRGGTNYVTPLDIMHIGLGAGSGFASASLVGRTLGALAGLRPESQRTLQQGGMWAGILSSVIPLAFGRR